MPQKKTTKRVTTPPEVPAEVSDRLTILAAAIAERRHKRPADSRTVKLIASGLPKMSQKLIEEAAEVAIDALRGDKPAVIQESADLLYNLTVLLSELGVEPAQIWAEMDRRHALFGLAEKIPKNQADRD